MAAYGYMLKWYAPKLLQQVNAEVAARMDRAAITMVNDVVKSFGSPPPEPAKGGGFKKNSSPAWKRGHPSAPGEPPNVQLGHLWRSIHFDRPTMMERRVGSIMTPGDKDNPNSGKHSYAWYLEKGTSRMAARPYLMPALRRMRSTIFRIIATGS